MLDSLKLRAVWLILEHHKAQIIPELNDSEVVQHILEQIQQQIFLSTSELAYTQVYVQSRISLIRDLAEVQLISGK